MVDAGDFIYGIYFHTSSVYAPKYLAFVYKNVGSIGQFSIVAMSNVFSEVCPPSISAVTLGVETCFETSKTPQYI